VIASPTANSARNKCATATIEHAERYIDHGSRLVPIQPNRKIPHTRLLRDLHRTNSWAFLRDTPATIDDVTRWTQHTPEVNLGVIPGNGLAVVDVDKPERFRGSTHPPTASVRTRRGFHLYFSGAASPRKASWGDIPSTYAVAPPSRVDGVSRYWVADTDVATLAPFSEFRPVDDASTLVEQELYVLALPPYEVAADQLAKVPAIALAAAHDLGIDIERVGQLFSCILPGHGPDQKPSANIWQGYDGVHVYRDHHRMSGPAAYTLAEVKAALVSRRTEKLGSPAQQYMWYHRLFYEAGLLDLPDVDVPPLPDGASRKAIKWREGFELALRISAVKLHPPCTAFAFRFAGHWCDLAQQSVSDAMKECARAQVFQQIGLDAASRSKLWGPGEGVR
jgi:hypothetical protein